MLFKSSYIPLAAAAFFALSTSRKNNLAAIALFALGLFERESEALEEKWQREYMKEEVRLDIEEEKRHEEEEED